MAANLPPGCSSADPHFYIADEDPSPTLAQVRAMARRQRMIHPEDHPTPKGSTMNKIKTIIAIVVAVFLVGAASPASSNAQNLDPLPQCLEDRDCRIFDAPHRRVDDLPNCFTNQKRCPIFNKQRKRIRPLPRCYKNGQRHCHVFGGPRDGRPVAR